MLKVLRTLQIPPPWFWCGGGQICQRFGERQLRRLPLELLRQLRWWLISPRHLLPRRPPSLTCLPWALTLRACWLNSYRPSELAWWWAVGERSWHALSRHAPESLAGALHVQRRRSWPDQCRPALSLLADKSALLARCPERWRAPFLVLPQEAGGASVQHQAPAWWWQALLESGLVLKPQSGHAGRAVIRFRWTDAGLEQQGLFRPPLDAASVLVVDAPPDPLQLLKHWQRLCRTDEPALAAPYLSHSSGLPPTEPSVVVRVITEQAQAAAPVGIRQAWLEVPLAEGSVAFISINGLCLPSPGPPLSASEQASQQGWQDLLKSGALAPVIACLEAARALHALLPPIDQVAWDWIPAEPYPLLLEGNGGFSLLVPQLFRCLGESAALPGVLPCAKSV
jgi:hypothetical protein